MRTADAASAHGAGQVGFTLALFVLVYFFVFGAGTVYILRLMAHAPAEGEAPLSGTPIRSAGITPAPAVEEGRR
jgi:cytochrome d ubiquinol oxidase subunit I